MGSLVRNTAVPGTRCGGFFSSIGDQRASGDSSRRVLSTNSRVPRRHVYMTTITTPASASGTQPPSTTFSRLATRKVRVDEDERRDQRDGGGQRPPPHLADHDECHDARHHHGPGDGDAVGRGQRARRAEQRDQQQHADQEAAVDARDIDLAVMRSAEVWRISRRGSSPSWIAWRVSE